LDSKLHSARMKIWVGVLHDVKFNWVGGSYKNFAVERRFAHLESMADFINGTAVDVAIRVSSKGVTIRFA
jgi:hypothetical protein